MRAIATALLLDSALLRGLVASSSRAASDSLICFPLARLRQAGRAFHQEGSERALFGHVQRRNSSRNSSRRTYSDALSRPDAQAVDQPVYLERCRDAIKI